jgi:hypothetical protein
MSTQPTPSVEQRCHLKVNVVGLFVHEPLVAVSVAPSRAVPDSAGTPVFSGGAASA